MRPFLAIILLAVSVGPAQARTWHVAPDGSGDAPTIAAAIDSATHGDVVEIGCGEYSEWGLIVKSGLTIRSESGQPDCVTIDGNQPVGFGSIFGCWGVDSSTLIEGLTITGGRASDPFYGSGGGGMFIASGSSLTVKKCVITGNYAKAGGGVSIFTSNPTFFECEISGNESMFYPGGVEVGTDASFTAIGTRIVTNQAGSGPPDGSVHASGEALLNCCEIEPANWLIEGSLVVDNSDCGPVANELRSWGAVKSLYR